MSKVAVLTITVAESDMVETEAHYINIILVADGIRYEYRYYADGTMTYKYRDGRPIDLSDTNKYTVRDLLEGDFEFTPNQRVLLAAIMHEVGI